MEFIDTLYDESQLHIILNYQLWIQYIYLYSYFIHIMNCTFIFQWCLIASSLRDQGGISYLDSECMIGIWLRQQMEPFYCFGALVLWLICEACCCLCTFRSNNIVIPLMLNLKMLVFSRVKRWKEGNSSSTRYGLVYICHLRVECIYTSSSPRWYVCMYTAKSLI